MSGFEWAIIGLAIGNIGTAISLNMAWRDIRALDWQSHTHFYNPPEAGK